jgi:hypothetical protein
MTTYPLEFHRRSEQKWALRAQAPSARETTPRAARVGHSQRGQRGSGLSERRDILGRSPWLREIGQCLRAEYDAVDHPVPECLAALLKELNYRPPFTPALVPKTSRWPDTHTLVVKSS